jgi:hypothetical protein
LKILTQATSLVILVVIFLGFMPVQVQSAPLPVKVELDSSGLTPWNVNNIKPGDIGFKTITVQNSGSDAGTLSIWLSDIVNAHTAATMGTGVLGNNVILKITGAGLYSNFTMPAPLNNFPQSTTDSKYIRIDNMAAGAAASLDLTWELPTAAGNDVQGDNLSFSINYTLEQLPPPVISDGGGVVQQPTPTPQPIPTSVPEPTATQPTSIPVPNPDAGKFLQVVAPETDAKMPVSQNEVASDGSYVVKMPEINVSISFS